jgi:AraC-like DNA-binding protein
LDAKAQGAPVEAFLARFDLSLSGLLSRRGDVPVPVLAAAWEWIPAVLRDEAYGLHVAQRLPEDGLYLADLALRSAPTVAEGARAFVEMLSRFSGHGAFRVTPAGDGFIVKQTAGAELFPQRHAWELVMAALLRRLRTGACRSIVPSAVSFAHRAPRCTAAHVEAFGVPVRFSAPATTLEIDARVSALPMRGHNPHLHRFVMGQERVPAAAPRFVDRVRAAVRDLLHGSATSGDVVAKRVGTSFRTMQRRLAADGIQFSCLIDEMRAELARDLLRDPEARISEVAFRLGYASPSALSRAFRRWFGATPRSFRCQPRDLGAAGGDPRLSAAA